MSSYFERNKRENLFIPILNIQIISNLSFCKLKNKIKIILYIHFTKWYSHTNISCLVNSRKAICGLLRI